MSKQTWFDNEIALLEDDLEFVTEEMAFDFVNEIRRVMKEHKISQSALAHRLGKSRAYVSKVLNYNPNMTIRSLAMISLALDTRLRWTRPRMVDKDAVDQIDMFMQSNSAVVVSFSYLKSISHVPVPANYEEMSTIEYQPIEQKGEINGKLQFANAA